MRVGGADTHVAALAIHHEGGARFGLHVQQPLRVLGTDTDTAHRREQILSLLNRRAAVSPHEQVLASVVLQVAVTVFHPHSKHVTAGRRKPYNHHALLPTDTIVDVSLCILGRVIVLPVFSVPLLRCMMINDNRHRCGRVKDCAEFNRHVHTIARHGSLPAVRLQPGHVDHSRPTLPNRGFFIGERCIHDRRFTLRHRYIILQKHVIDQVVAESHGADPWLQAGRLVLPRLVGDGKVLGPVVERYTDHDLFHGLLVLGSHRAGDGTTRKRQEGHRVQVDQVGGRHLYGVGVIVAVVALVDEAHLVTAHRHLADDERTVVVGETDVVGALDHNEGTRVTATRCIVERTVPGDGSGRCQRQIHHRGFKRRHRGPGSGLHPVSGRLDKVGALVEPREHVHALGVGDRGPGAA